jgi:hypothetical protein
MAIPPAQAIRYKSVQRTNPTHFGLSASILIADTGKYTVQHSFSKSPKKIFTLN